MPPSQRRSHVRRANVTACMRCKSRKQRCDQSVPACSNCEAAGVECVSVDTDGRIAPRSYIHSLEDRIAHLEKQLIAHGVSDYDSPAPDTPSSAQPLGPAPASSLLSVNRSSDVPSLLLGPIKNIAAAEGLGTGAGRQFDSLLNNLPYKANIDLPSKDAAQMLSDAYFEHSEFFSPVIWPHDFSAIREAIQKDRGAFDAAPVRSKFRVLLVFAIAARLMNRKDASFPNSRSEAYYASAMSLLSAHPHLLQKADVDHLENLGLVIQYNLFSSNLSAAWYLLGFATRMAIDMGLHNEGNHISPDQPSDAENRRRWIFWTVCSFERIQCAVLNRPCSILDEAINTPLPWANDSNSGSYRHGAIHLIKHRRILSKIHQTVAQNPLAASHAPPDYAAWREGMRQRLQEWLLTAPKLDNPTQLVPVEMFDGVFHNSIVFVYMPWPHMPPLTDFQLTVLAGSASCSVNLYKVCFREGKLRFYWRTIHHLFRAGVALVHCASVLVSRGASNLHDLTLADLKASISTCSAVLWGMVERYRPGQPYRDAFENIMSSTMSLPGSSASPSVFTMQMELELEPLLGLFGTNDDFHALDELGLSWQ